MSDPVADMLRGKAQGAKPQASSDPVADILKRGPREKKEVTTSSSPYAYYDPTFRREHGIENANAKPLVAGAAGFNRGVAEIVGFPVTGLKTLADATGAGIALAGEALTGTPAHKIYDIIPNSQVPLTNDWFANVIDSTPLGPVTPNPYPNDASSRVAYAAGVGVPGAMVGGGGGAPVVAEAAGGAAGALAGELGLDPSGQMAAGLLGGVAAARAMQPRTPTAAPPLAPLKDTPDDVAPRTAVDDAQAKLNANAADKSMGAAGAAIDLKKHSPEFQEAVVKATNETGGAVNKTALERHAQADSLPVKIRLSEGQALGDERLISLELNARGKQEAYSKGFQEQNKALIENTRAFRDEAGPDVFSTNAVEHADTLINRYKAIDDVRRAEITQKYKALEEANGGQFPVDGAAFIKAADAALAKKMKGRYLPKEVRGDIEEFRDNAGQMTFEQFENLRTNLATEARKAERSGDGNAAAAVNIVRRELESLPMSAENSQLKALADSARNAAKQRFDALDADPAYKAAVNDSVAPDAFIRKYVTGGTRDNVALLNEAMSGDPVAIQTLRVATLDHLRQAGGIDANYNGNFTQAGYNKALQALDPKILSLLGPELTEQARTLGDVARYTQFQPKGSFANNSNTMVAAAAEKAADALEGIVNYKTGGIPIASEVRRKINENQARKAAEKTFAPGAGLTRLSDLAKMGKSSAKSATKSATKEKK